MPIEDFNGRTFVAYLDISGFKKKMENRDEALGILNAFYSTGYRVLSRQNYNCRIEGIFVSDCGVLFVREGSDEVRQIEVLLRVIREINREMLNKDIMLTTSIAYGDFYYQNRIEFRGIEKNPVYGNAYVDAFLDNESGKPKIQPGQCRIVKRNLPQNVKEAIKERNNEIFKLVKKREGDREHYYFYWNCQKPSEIRIFERNYSEAEKFVYDMYLKALKGEYWIQD